MIDNGGRTSVPPFPPEYRIIAPALNMVVGGSRIGTRLSSGRL
jgi:hypothetical protein